MSAMLPGVVALALAASASPSPATSPGLPPAVQAALGRYRIAEPEDFVASIRKLAAAHPERLLTRGLVTEDLNGDGLPDYALLCVDRRTREFRFLFAVSGAGGNYGFVERRHYRGAFPQYGGIVYTAMETKLAGDDSWADKLYSHLAPGSPERAAFAAVPALALWRSVGLDPYGRADDFDASTLGYCRDVYYYPGGKLATLMVCQ